MTAADRNHTWYDHPAIDAAIDGMEAGEQVMQHPPESAPIHGATTFLSTLHAAGYDVVARTPDTPTDSDTAARARALLDAATDRPWIYDNETADVSTKDGLIVCYGFSDHDPDAELIAAAPTLITDLLGQVDILVQIARARHRQVKQYEAERDAAVARADALTAAIDPRFRDCWTPRTTGATGDVSELGEAPCGDCPGCRLDDALDRGTDR